MDFSKLGLAVPDILLPRPGVDLCRWAVVACDQFTAEPQYWEQVAEFIQDQPSTLQLIFPEVYLGKEDERQSTSRIERINRTMRQYIDAGILVPQGPGMIYLERRTDRGKIRKGLMVALDLEEYDYRPGSHSLVRATEGTVLDRLPPRIRIREQACLELPHIMVLIDDPQKAVIEPLEALKQKLPQLYDTDLMLQGGHLAGYRVNDPDALDGIYRGLAGLLKPDTFSDKYRMEREERLLYAVGDGNHSLATAKAVWESLKAGGTVDPNTHPARYALVEIVNLHDPALQFEPIHRAVFHTSPAALLQAMQHAGFDLEFSGPGQPLPERMMELKRRNPQNHVWGYITENGSGLITKAQPRHQLEVGTLQEFLDDWMHLYPQSTVDYIHGDEVVQELGRRPDTVGFFLPVLSKQALFKTVMVDGVLPRKSFSMGTAEEKRYYMECRKIR